MKLTRSLVALATPVLAMAAISLTGPPAHAEGTCTLSPPSRIAISQQFTMFPATITGDCAPDGRAAWYLGNPDAESYLNIAVRDYEDEDSPYIVSIHGDASGLGRQTWRGDGAWLDKADYEADCGADSDDDIDLGRLRTEAREAGPDSAMRQLRQAAIGDCEGTLTQNAPVTDIRLAGGAYLSASRSRGVVTLDATSLVYLPEQDAFVKRAGQAGEFQFQEPGSTVWQRLKTVRTGSGGTARLQYRFGSTRSYRFALYSTPNSFDVVSTTRTS